MDFAFKKFIEWFIENWLRPLLILSCGMLLFDLPTFIYKIRLTLQGILYLLFCNDKSWKKPQDPAVIFNPAISSGGEGLEKKTIYFVRHGESTWNDTFNKGSHRSALVFVLGFIPGMIKAILYELYLVLSGKMDSWFYDAPCSNLGLSQADELAKFLKKAPSKSQADFVSILRADPGAPPSRILCSNLRRALSTIAAGFRDRFRRHAEDKILIVPSLQEISRNPDTLSITPAHTQVTASWIDRTSRLCDFQAIFTNQTDMSLHTGNKPINTNGLIRMNAFCDFAFSGVKEEHLIVGGHSIWFRTFFKTFLPYQVNHVAKNRKIVNGGVVAFTLMKLDTPKGSNYMVDQNSIQVIYGGF